MPVSGYLCGYLNYVAKNIVEFIWALRRSVDPEYIHIARSFIAVPVVQVMAAIVASYLPAARVVAINAVDALKAQ